MRRGLILGAASVALTLVVTGCSQDSAKVVYNAVEPEHITLSPPNVTVTKQYGGRLGTTLVEVHTVYANGDKGDVYFRSENGSLRQTSEEYANGTVKSNASFDKDGKLVSGEVNRPNGKRFVTVNRLESGVTQATFYDQAGNKLLFREKAADNLSWTETLYRPDGSPMGKAQVVIDDSGINSGRTVIIDENTGKTGNAIDQYIDVTPQGRNARRFRVQFMAPPPGTNYGGHLIQYFNQQGKTEFTQLWRYGNWQQQTGTNLHLEQVDEYDWSGVNVQRSLFFNEEDGVVSLVAAKTKEWVWAKNGGRNMPFAMGLPFIGIGSPTSGLSTAMNLIAQTQQPQILPAPRPFQPRPIRPIRPGGTSSQVDVVRSYRLGEKDIKNVLLEAWEVKNQWNPSFVQKYERQFHNGTLEKVTKGEKVEKHEAKENLHETVDLKKFKTSSYAEFEQARQNFQREDTAFFGAHQKNDLCRTWYMFIK